MKCIQCSSCQVTKNGTTKSKIQIYRCKECNRQFQSRYKNQSWIVKNEDIIQLIKEGCGIRSISRILQISPTTVIRRIKTISETTNRPFPIVLGKEYEIDEMSTYVGNKKRRIWITYALRKDTKEVIDFVVGTRSNKAMRQVTDTVLLSKPTKVFTDKYSNYFSLIPGEIHMARKRCTNYIERNNLTLRTHLKRLNRKTLCYSKSQIMLKACLKIYFWG